MYFDRLGVVVMRAKRVAEGGNYMYKIPVINSLTCLGCAGRMDPK